MKANGQSAPSEGLVAKVSANPRYRGKWLIIIHGKVFSHPRGMAGVRKVKALLKHYPRETPTIVYVPKAETLILLL